MKQQAEQRLKENITNIKNLQKKINSEYVELALYDIVEEFEKTTKNYDILKEPEYNNIKEFIIYAIAQCEFVKIKNSRVNKIFKQERRGKNDTRKKTNSD